MKILQLIDQLNLGGAERVCVNVTNMLHREGVDVTLGVFQNRGPLSELIDPSVEAIFFDLKNDRKSGLKKLLHQIDQSDVVHIHLRHNFKYIKKIIFWRRIKKKLILHDHYGKIMIKDRVPTFFKTIYKPDFYIGCSETLVNWAKNKVKLAPERCFYIPNIVVKYPTKKPSTRNKGMVLVANFKPVKNHIFALKIAKAMKMHLTIYATQNDESSFYKEILSTVEELEISELVHFKFNVINVQEELNQFNFGLSTALSESGPLILLEYLAQGIPFLSFNTGQITNYIKKKLPGLIMTNFNIEEWIERAETMNTYKEKDLRTVFDMYSDDGQFLQQYMGLYEKVMGEY